MNSTFGSHISNTLMQRRIRDTQLRLLNYLELRELLKLINSNCSKNRMLLWHGSRLTNWACILSQGLRIAPPEAPVTGYMFGKGVYFADMFSNSANYCYCYLHFLFCSSARLLFGRHE